MNNTSVFAALGLEVVACEGGVYHVRRPLAPNEVLEQVGVLLSEGPVDAQATVKLFLQDIPEPGLAVRMLQHWQNLDARRLEESGIAPLLVRRDANTLGEGVQALEFERPDGVRTRHAVRMRSGDVVCYN